MTNNLRELTAGVVKELFGVEIMPAFSRPAPEFGDYATNIAMQLAGQVGKPPREVAEAIADRLAQHDITAQVAGPGFINISLPDNFIFESINPSVPQSNINLLLEYSCPNPFKELHVGHLYQTILGDALGRVYERLGARLYRVNYGGDVGPHVARSLWAMIQELGGENPEGLSDIPESEHAKWLAKVYVAGTAAYESDESAKREIDSINKRIYELHNNGDKDSPFAQIYWTTRQWSYQYFKKFYKELKVVPFDRYIGESESFEPGMAIVDANIGSVFEESDGAIILSEKKSGQHTRVFITSKGLPTYETKDLGVITLEAQEFEYDKRIIMTGNDQREYMKVVFAAMNLVNPDLGAKQQSLTHGIVKFGDGKKMSSRLGNVTRAVDVLNAAREAVQSELGNENDIALGAVKYTFLKSSIGGDISFDLEQSVSTEGNSGPYLQYALVRARAIMRNMPEEADLPQVTDLDPYERSLASWLSRYPEALQACVDGNSLHDLCTYLYELSQVFNRFYETSRVIDDPRADVRIPLVKSYENILSDGLTVLGIPTPEQM